MSDLTVMRASDVAAILRGREQAVMDIVASAYLQHRAGHTVLPHSSFLRPRGDDAAERIIALPAALNDDEPISGLKWIASFPRNTQRGVPRASAVLISNCPETGQPRALLESALISSARTAASAACAALALHGPQETHAGFIGCGPINTEVARYLKVAMPTLTTFLVRDVVPARAEAFAAAMKVVAPDVQCKLVASAEAVFAEAPLVSLATVATEAHIHHLRQWTPQTTVLHVSLRDLGAELVTEVDNVVDDVDHVLRANTSLHRAEQRLGHRRFVRCTLADVLAAAQPARTPGRPLVFSPFGLGFLDLAVARLVLSAGARVGLGVRIEGFLSEMAES